MLRAQRGLTALHVASKYGHTAVVKILLEQSSANVDIDGRNGLTPLHVATRYNRQDTSVLLLDSGANTHRQAKVTLSSLRHITPFSLTIALSYCIFTSSLYSKLVFKGLLYTDSI